MLASFLALFSRSLILLEIRSSLCVWYASTALALVLLRQANPQAVHVTILAVVHLPPPGTSIELVSSLEGRAVQYGQLGNLLRRASSPLYETERVRRISTSSLPPQMPQI